MDLGTGQNSAVKITDVGFKSTLYYRPIVTVLTWVRDSGSLSVISEPLFIDT